MTEFRTFTVVPGEMSRDKLFIPMRWVDTTVKARLVAEEIAAYMRDEFFAPSSTTVKSKLVGSAASSFKRSRLCVEVSRAFLHCEEDEEVYMKPPDLVGARACGGWQRRRCVAHEQGVVRSKKGRSSLGWPSRGATTQVWVGEIQHREAADPQDAWQVGRRGAYGRFAWCRR